LIGAALVAFKGRAGVAVRPDKVWQSDASAMWRSSTTSGEAIGWRAVEQSAMRHPHGAVQRSRRLTVGAGAGA
jgi:hypothetical protein